jgi:undecaprenyl-phosphate galactose phosphotransferase
VRPRAVAAALVLLVTDVAAVAGSYALAFALRGWVVSGLFGLLPDPMPFVSMARRAYLLLVFVPVLAYEGLYTKRFVDWEETRRCFRGVLVASAGVVIMVFALRYLELSRIVMAMALVIALVAVPVARVLVRELLARTRLLSRPLVLVGGGPAADAFSRELARHPSVGYEVAGQVERASPQEPVERLLERAVEAAGGAILAVFPDSFAPEELAAVIRYAERRLSDIMMVPSAAPLRAQSVDIEQVGSALVMKYRYNLLRPLNRYVKRAIEVPACAVLLVLLSPLLGLLAVLVRLSSRGPALFRQPRVGRGRRTFACLKFRTMYTDAEGRLR